MALPQKIVEQLGRPPARTPGWSGQLLMFSGTLFFISLLIFFGIRFGYSRYLSAEVKALDKKINELVQQVPEEDQAGIINFFSQIANVKTLLGNHVVGSGILRWLEENTHPNIYFTSFSFNAQSRNIILPGIAKNFTDIVEQLQIFSAAVGEIEKVNFSNALLQGNQWQFSMTLILTPEFVQGSSALPQQ